VQQIVHLFNKLGDGQSCKSSSSGFSSVYLEILPELKTQVRCDGTLVAGKLSIDYHQKSHYLLFRWEGAGS